MNLTDLETFVRVAEVGTMSSAARQLGVPKSTVSRRLSRLEQSLGVALLRRSARSFTLTDDGQALQARCAPALRQIAEAQRNLSDAIEEPRGQLSVTVSIDFGVTARFAALVAGFRRVYPGVSLQVMATNRMVDLVEEGFDVAFRLGPAQLPDSDSLMCSRLGDSGGGIYASPSYLERVGEPTHPTELKAHALLSHTATPFQGGWPLQHSETDSVITVPVVPKITLNDFAPLGALLAEEAGFGLLPRFVAAEYVARGQLVSVLPDWCLAGGNIWLVWLRSSHLAPRVRSFIDYVKRNLETDG